MQTDRPRWRSRAWNAALVLLGALLVALAVTGFDDAASLRAILVVTLAVALAVVAWAVATTRAHRRRYEEELTAWAGERAAQVERLAIARDLHDLASHGLGLITVRAAAARAVAGPVADGERSAALADIEVASREAMVELRRMLTVLRSPGQAPLAPAETLLDLPGIVENANRAGLRVTLEMGELGEVTPGVQVAVCAVVREALNNTLRHSGPSRVSVGVTRRGRDVVVSIQDAGGGSGWQPHPGAGHGLDGLRERISALDGVLEAGPAEDGWRVLARIPDQGGR